MHKRLMHSWDQKHDSGRQVGPNSELHQLPEDWKKWSNIFILTYLPTIGHTSNDLIWCFGVSRTPTVVYLQQLQIHHRHMDNNFSTSLWACMCWVITVQSDMVSYTKSCSSLIFNQLEKAERWSYGQQFLNSALCWVITIYIVQWKLNWYGEIHQLV